MEPVRLDLVACVVPFTLAAAYTDARFRRLPNALTVPAFLAGLVYHIVVGALSGGFMGALNHLGWSLGGFAVGFGILFVLWVMQGGFGGDVKLMGALGAWLGPWWTLQVYIVSALFALPAMIISLAYLATQQGVGKVQKKYLSQPGKSAKKKEDPKKPERQKRRLLPYAVLVALATWSVLAFHAYRQVPSEAVT